MSDGSQQGVSADRALGTILGGEEPPSEEEEKTPQWWLDHLLGREDDVGSYEGHAETMAKYIILAYRRMPGLVHAPNSPVWLTSEWGDKDYDVVVLPDLSDCLKKVYADEDHPFRKALGEATGFSWGWAFNIARYALELPPQPNPAIITVG